MANTFPDSTKLRWHILTREYQGMENASFYLLNFVWLIWEKPWQIFHRALVPWDTELTVIVQTCHMHNSVI